MSVPPNRTPNRFDYESLYGLVKCLDADAVNSRQHHAAAASQSRHRRRTDVSEASCAARPLAPNCDLFKRGQNRIAKEIDLAQAEINRAEATDSPYGELLATALGIIQNARKGYSAADP